MAASTCRRIPCKITELRLDKALVCGQSFRWKERTPGVWTGVLAGYMWNLWQSDTELFYQVLPSPEHPHGTITADNHINIAIKTEPVQICENTETVRQEEFVKQHTSKGSKMRTFSTKKGRKGVKVIDKQSEQVSTPTLDCQHVDVKVSKPKIEHKYEDMKVHSPTLDCKHECLKLELDQMETSETSAKHEEILRDYFRLDVNLTDLYTAWSLSDPVFKRTAIDFTGIRILRQDPVENLFSFICSSNNHISRISGMVERLCQTYGTKVTEYKGESYFNFPSVESLSGPGVEDRLRSLGFGYRAKYISVTAKYIQANHSEEWLRGLRNKPYTQTKSELVKLCGVGAKVADCVCLMSMDKLEAVPVDTHVWQIAARDYMPKLKQAKSLTDKLYGEIGDHFRELWGDKAGWAHTVLFAADLKKFKNKPDTKEIDVETSPNKSQAKGYKRSKSSVTGGGKRAKQWT
ncbi:N-glycosylase/DNA lyase [Mizuhopecten yessoensis]|uniref:N-glycosylase/DNA lyase n=2 Tax=Mizuhopecten yessoensis TaxID=6573 RepID=A0A210R1C6_MIZYE|nr:N-glycosylase/DNA lyase [Mizuhopecten yessoensis]